MANPSTESHTHTTIKETVESIVIAFVFAFVFRAYVVEAFVIPTGSMAPTLLGQHLRIECPQCGYRFKSDGPEFRGQIGQMGRRRLTTLGTICPMCRYPVEQPPGARRRAGDRILVHKYIYRLSEPRRWDVVVFKNPADPYDNYIKRLVGLPDEQLLIIEGNVYVKPIEAPQSDWRIARKTDLGANPNGYKIQRAMWQPIYHSQYLPLDGGRNGPRRQGRWYKYQWRTPWTAQQGDWNMDGQPSYRHDSRQRGRITFDFARQRTPDGRWYAYNQFKNFDRAPQPIEDVRVAVDFEPDEDGLSVSVATTARLDQEKIDADSIMLLARITGDGRASLEISSYEPNGQTLRRHRIVASKTVRPLKRGHTTSIELWYVDQRAILWIEGRPELIWSFDFADFDKLKRRKPLAYDRYPQISIAVEGSPVTLHRVQVDRDVAYTSVKVIGRRDTGTIVKKLSGRFEGEPVEILANQFFCLGDNSPLSSDGRRWSIRNERTRVDPWVAKTLLPDTNHRYGVVPRQLMIGRAFFVYFPAPYPATRHALGIFPNFGEMRFIH